MKFKFAGNGYNRAKNYTFVGISFPTDGRIYFWMSDKKSDICSHKMQEGVNEKHFMITSEPVLDVLVDVGQRSFDLKTDSEKELLYIELSEGVEL